MTPSEFPMRINRYLALRGYSTRKGADELIEKSRVLINGKQAKLGDKVLATDVVEVKVAKKPEARSVYMAYYKPRGVTTPAVGVVEKGMSRDIQAVIKQYKLFPVGRLDKDSHGLLLLTNDGRITDRLLHPDKDHDKEYIVSTKLKLRDSFKKHVEGGVDIEGYQTRPTRVRLMGENTFSITLTEGKRHQIRRMVVALHNEVTDLKRIRIMNIRLSNMKSGEFRSIEGDELNTFLASLKL